MSIVWKELCWLVVSTTFDDNVVDDMFCLFGCLFILQYYGFTMDLCNESGIRIGFYWCDGDGN